MSKLPNIDEALVSSGNLHIPPKQWLKELFEDQNCPECHRGVRGHDAVPLNGNWFARCKPRKCNGLLYVPRGLKARCIQPWGTEHLHHDHDIAEAVQRGLAVARRTG